jgi:hypothetical protein
MGDVIEEKDTADHSSHEISEVEYIIHDMGVLLNDVGKSL